MKEPFLIEDLSFVDKKKPFLLLRHKLFDARITTVYCPIEWSTRGLTVPIDTSKTEKISVLTENYGFEYNVTSILLAVREVFGMSGF